MIDDIEDLLGGTDGSREERAETDLVALGIATAAILIFVATASAVFPAATRALMGLGPRPDQLLANALLLNIALIIFGWRRYRELSAEIAERRKAERLARQLAETDHLTGCLNRRSLARHALQLHQNACNRELELAIAIIDLDNFKQVNDTHGHDVGDRLLSALAQRMRQFLPRDSLIARLGGDEFAIVLPYQQDRRDRLDMLVVNLFERLQAPIDIEGRKVETALSIGLSGQCEEDAELDSEAIVARLMQRADIAMYQAKKRGRNRYFWFEPSMEKELQFRRELEAGIREGIAAGQFVPFYEQQIDLESGELVGFEMLARWNSPRFGRVLPEVFIPIAEETGVIVQLSEALMTQALEDAKQWHPSLSLSVNISPIQMRDPWFAQKLLKLLVEHNFPPSRLEIEITESSLHEDIGMVRSMIASLRNQGVRVSLDDFGTGYASFEQLRDLTFDRLKIDRSFISRIKAQDPNSTIVDAILALSDGLKMTIIAEGIEDEAVLGVLKGKGRLLGQGYHYGQPEDRNAVSRRLREAGLLAPANGSAIAASGQASASPSATPPGRYGDSAA